MTKVNNFLIYGANGYTAKLILELCEKEGIKPTIAGRTRDKILPIAEKYDLPYEIVSIDEEQKLLDLLTPFDLVLNCAGPFTRTFKAMTKACLQTKTHYLDITGEIEVFEGCAYLGKKAEAAGIILLPGVGFDVVPSDCLAKYIHENLPQATHLELAFVGLGGGVSRGTATTAIENLGRGGAIRENGKIKLVKNAHAIRQIQFDPSKDRKTPSATIPWGDVSTAFHSTGIPNIMVYLGLNDKSIRMMKFGNYFGWLVGSDFMKKRMLKKVWSGKPGPTAEEREQSKSLLWGIAKDADGNEFEARLECPEGYTLTAMTALESVKRVLADKSFKSSGFLTPSLAFGSDYITNFAGVKRT